MKIQSIALAAALGLAMALPSAAAEREVNFTYVETEAPVQDWGTQKLESYDVAIHLDDPALSGNSVKGFTCPLATVENISGITGWLSAQVTLDEDEVNVPQVVGTTTVDVENKMVTVVFDEPYVITREGVFVGLSFKVDELTAATKKPVAVVPGTNVEGFWIHSSRTYRKWRTLEHRKMVLPMDVILFGDFSDYCVAVSTTYNKSVQADTPFELKLGITNFGSTEVNSIDYSYNVGELASSGSYTLEEPIPAHFGSKAIVNLPIDAISEWGTQDLELTITGVNGEPNESVNASASVEITVIGFVPVNRPLMEEYTGLWCGFCPRGYIALERMAKDPVYNDKFVTLSLHASGRDPMQVVKVFPQNPGGFPAAFLNRTELVDPYFGSSSATEMGIINDLEVLAEAPTLADISVTCDWKDDTKKELVCRSVLRFPNDHSDVNYKVAYAVLADGLTEIDGVEFEQSNYFSKDKYVSGEDWEVFVNGGDYVKGLVFNDILVAFEDMDGVKGSVPSEIKYGKEYVHSYTYATPFLNIYGQQMVKDYSKVRVVAMLIVDKVVVNAAKSGYVGTSAINEVSVDNNSDADVVSREYFDIEGRRIYNPGEGKLYIRVDHLSDGTTRPVKVVR